MSLSRTAGAINASLLLRNDDSIQPYEYSVLTRLEPEECRWPRSAMRALATANNDWFGNASLIWDFATYNYTAGFSGKMPVITGITTDSSGGIVGSAFVTLYDTATDLVVDPGVTSHPTTGVYVATSPTTNTCYAVAYKTGSPDKAGTTVNTLTPV